MHPTPSEPPTEAPPSFTAGSLFALTLLLNLFHELSDTPVTDPVEFSREVEIRWHLWRDIEGWSLPSTILGGHIELHLRERVLGVRCFHGDASVVRLRILIDEKDGLTALHTELADDPNASFVAARLLELVSQHGVLQPLERSLARAISKRIPVEVMSLDLWEGE